MVIKLRLTHSMKRLLSFETCFYFFLFRNDSWGHITFSYCIFVNKYLYHFSDWISNSQMIPEGDKVWDVVLDYSISTFLLILNATRNVFFSSLETPPFVHYVSSVCRLSIFVQAVKSFVDSGVWPSGRPFFFWHGR